MKKMKIAIHSRHQIRAIVVAAGIGKRFGSSEKVFVEFYGKPVFIRAIEPFENIEEIRGIWVVTRRDMLEKTKYIIKKFGLSKIEGVIQGGEQRQDSVFNALKKIPADTDIVIIHDAARPMISKKLIKRVIDTLILSFYNSEVELDSPELKNQNYSEKSHHFIDGVIPVIPLTDTIKWLKRGDIVGGTLNRDILKAVQTPQAFWFKKLLQAYEKAYKEGFYGTDDSSLIERYCGKVLTVEGEKENIKITIKDDIKKLEFSILNQIYESLEGGIKNLFLSSIRIGIGYDSHRFIEGKKLIIGGVKIPFEKGLYGYSDADVLIHAIIDAILGSAGLGDIGTHFPETDPAYKDISSLILLEKTLKLVKTYKVKPLWIDCTIFAEKPKMAFYIPEMLENIKKFGLNVNIKAKTNEGMGFIGRGEGIAAQAVCLSVVNLTS